MYLLRREAIEVLLKEIDGEERVLIVETVIEVKIF